MKIISDSVHSDMLKILSIVESLPRDGSVKREEMKRKAAFLKKKLNQNMRHLESTMQKNCITWFRLQYPEYSLVLFSVPNGGRRDKITASILKAEGAVAGVSDVILLLPRHGYSSLCIEFKTKDGRQSKSQKEWQKAIEDAGSKYVVIRSFDEFRKEIDNYLL